MTDNTLQPLTPLNCDLRDFEFMPLDVQRLFSSDFWLVSVAAEKVAAIELWGRSWHQVPAGSLPADDRLLAALSGARDAWPQVRDQAMRGWTKCTDGRWYHPVVCAKALEAWIEKLKHRISSASGNAKRWGTEAPDVERMNEEILVARNLLITLNPNSRTLKKKLNSLNKKDSHPGGIPVGSQETGTGTETGTKEVGGKPPTTPGADAPPVGNPTGMPPGSADGETDDAAKAAKSADGGQPPGRVKKTAPAGGEARPRVVLADRNLEVPAWMPAEEWAAFEQNRWAKHSRAPYTAVAQKGIVKRLTELRDLGHDPALVLAASVRNSWTDVFALTPGRMAAAGMGGATSGQRTLGNAQNAKARLQEQQRQAGGGEHAA